MHGHEGVLHHLFRDGDVAGQQDGQPDKRAVLRAVSRHDRLSGIRPGGSEDRIWLAACCALGMGTGLPCCPSPAPSARDQRDDRACILAPAAMIVMR
jgi:hypothetical protein